MGLDTLLTRLMPAGREEVKLVRSPDGEETFILARSADRRKKERAVHRRFLDRMTGALRS